MKYPGRLRAARAVDIPSALIALALTVAAFASVLVVSARTLLFQSGTLRVERTAPQETLVYLERLGITAPQIEQPPHLRSARVGVVKPEVPLALVRPQPAADRTAAPPMSSKPSALAGPAPVFLPPYRPQPRSTPSPFDVPRRRNPFLAEEPRTRAEIDSMLMELRHAIPLLAATRTPTAAERDSLIKEQTRERLIPGRAPQMSGGAGMSIGLPLFSSGPSAAERRRDSAANTEYVARLRRLQARVSASRESLRVADSMSRARTP